MKSNSFGYHGLFKTVAYCKKWHELFDEHFESVDQISKGNFRYMLWADPNVAKEIEAKYAEQLTALSWKKTKAVSKTTNFLIVDTDKIPNFSSFIERLSNPYREYYDGMFFGNTPIENALKNKKEGNDVKIIALREFCQLLSSGNFGETTVAEKAPATVSATVKVETKEEKAAKILAKQTNRSDIAEKLIAQILQDCHEKSRFMSSEEIYAKIDEAGLSHAFFDRHIHEKYGKSVRKFFEDSDVIRSLKHDFYDTLAILKARYETRARVQEVSQLIADNADMDLSIICNNAKKLTDMTARQLLLSRGILDGEEIPCHEDLLIGVLHKPGNEPINVKKRLSTLFAKLDEAYPDKVIEGLHRDHKNWGETVTELYRLLGYANSKSFLMAYGYTVSDNKGGRTSNNNDEIIAELQRRYPNGAPFTSVAQLKEANKDLAPKIKSLENISSARFGMSLKNYLISQNVLVGDEKKTVTKYEAREEAECKARDEAERKAREEAERKTREEAERKAREEAERKAREEAERKTREEAERKAREEAERKKAREEAERKKARENIERQAKLLEDKRESLLVTKEHLKTAKKHAKPTALLFVSILTVTGLLMTVTGIVMTMAFFTISGILLASVCGIAACVCLSKYIRTMSTVRDKENAYQTLVQNYNAAIEKARVDLQRADLDINEDPIRIPPKIDD